MLVTVVLVYFILIVVLRADPNTLQYTTASFLPCIISVVFPFALMPWVLRKFNLPTNIYTLYKYRMLQKTEGILSRSLSINMDDKQLNASHEGLRDTLQRKHGFNLLARHLSKEFAIENFLFFVETQQWLQSLYNRPSFAHLKSVDDEKYNYDNLVSPPPQSSPPSDDEQPDVKRVISFSGLRDVINMSPVPKHKSYDLLTIKFHESIPKSNILRHYKTDLMTVIASSSDDVGSDGKDEEDFDAIYEESVNIFQKYIPNSAYFSVNISYNCRQQLFAKFGYDESIRNARTSGAISDQRRMLCTVKENCNSEETIVQLFEDARQQVYKYLIYSYTRFKKTAEFKQLMAYHAKNEESDGGYISEHSYSK